jgi:hypothetical protein
MNSDFTIAGDSTAAAREADKRKVRKTRGEDMEGPRV